MNTTSSELEKNLAKKLIDNWDNNGLAFFLALVSAMAFCFACITSDDGLSVWLQLFGIAVLYLMMWRIPIYYVAKTTGFSDKSSASLGLTVCFAILTALLLIKSRDQFYYFAFFITLMFALLMVWRMNMKDSRVNVRKTFTASTVAVLAQCVLGAIMLSDSSDPHPSKTATQVALTTVLLIACVVRLVNFLWNRGAIELKVIGDVGGDDE